MTPLALGAGSSAGPLGLLIVLLLGVATALLIRNMNGRLKRLPKSFDEPAGPVTPPEDGTAGPSSGPTAGA